ncbi:MAG: hypothetical protein IJ484_03480 [Oscillospiraceae bacterium]|nr:hypothetical protein [Oscillospiraceae bacterium]
MKRFRIAIVLLAVLAAFAFCGSYVADRRLTALDQALVHANEAALRSDWAAAAYHIQSAQAAFAQQEKLLQLFARRDLLSAAGAELAGLENMADEDSFDDLALGIARARHHLSFIKNMSGAYAPWK